MVFHNTADKTTTVADAAAFVNAARGGFDDAAAAVSTGRPSRTPQLQNVHTFEGARNPLRLSRVYTQTFLCVYDMGNYPFDYQRCKLQFAMPGELVSD